MKLDLNWLQNNPQYILLECISGSHAYGTNIPESDRDIRGVFVLPQEQLYGLERITQINDEDNDIVYYELGRFCELLLKSNPTCFELLNPPQDCILQVNQLFQKYFIDKRSEYLTKACNKTFLAYAQQQISKATGLNKKMNWEKNKVERKDLLDFCYVLEDEKSIPWKKWNDYGGKHLYEEKFIGAVNIPNAKDTYALFYDGQAEMYFSEKHSADGREKIKQYFKSIDKPLGFGYKGLVKIGEEDENGKVNYGISNQLRLSSIPKGEKSFATIVYNKDGYTESMKDFKSYQEWLQNRNTQRYVDIENHKQMIDGKNCLHLVRLIETAKDIVEKGDIIVRRNNRDELLSIRQGKVNLEELITKSDSLLKEVGKKFEESNLPEDLDKSIINNLLIDLRIRFYNS